MSRRFQFVVVAFSSAVVALLLFGAVGRSASPDAPYTNLGVYSEVLSRIKADYVEEPDMKAVTVGAINGMLESLDPHASYLTADQYKQYLKSKDSKKADVGLVLAKRFGYMSVEDAIPGSPAEKAGFSTGDVIESINNVSTRDMPPAFAEQLLQGDSGTRGGIWSIARGANRSQEGQRGAGDDRLPRRDRKNGWADRRDPGAGSDAGPSERSG